MTGFSNLCTRSCVHWKSLYVLLRAMDIPICVTACNGNPYMRYCVQRKITSPNADPGPLPAVKIPNPNPRTALYALLRTMEIPICVTAYNGKSLHTLLRSMEKQQPRRRPQTAASRENPQFKTPDRRRPLLRTMEIPICITAYA